MSDEKYINELQKDLKDLLISAESLKLSHEKCHRIGIKPAFTFEEQESFDSLSFKFARTSDIYTQKVIKTVFLLLRESPGTFIDKANLAEKLEIIPSADDLIYIRDLRNEIVHEYLLNELPRIYKEILLNFNKLQKSIDLTKEYIIRRGWYPLAE